MITQDMKRIIESHPAGCVATVNADGTPNVSTKGTMVVLDDTHIIFAEIRSPVTLRNIKNHPAMEILFLDVLARKCVKVKGTASIITTKTEEFSKLHPCFLRWGDLSNIIKNIIKLHITSARIDLSPAYDIGQTEDDLRSQWKKILV